MLKIKKKIMNRYKNIRNVNLENELELFKFSISLS